MKPTPVKPTNIQKIHPNKTDREQVRVLAGLGAPREFIADELKLTLDDLDFHYSEDLIQGPLEANARVAQTFFELATSGDYPQMTLSWLKMRANWSENLPTTTSTEEAEAELSSVQDRLRALLQNRPEVVKKLSGS